MRPTLRFRAARLLLRAILSALFKVRTGGLGNLPDGPHILACNHLNWVDPFLVLAYLPARPRIHYLGRRSAVFNRAFKRALLRFIGGVIPVEAGHGELPALTADLGRLFQRGGVLGMFPEGRLGEREGALQPLRPGVAHFARSGGVPVVPVGLSGTRLLWLRRPIWLQVGEPVELGGAGEVDLTRLASRMLANLPAVEEGPGRRRWLWLTTLLR